MKGHASKASRKPTDRSRHNSSAGANAVAFAPPAYGLEFVDRESADVIQRNGATATKVAEATALPMDLANLIADYAAPEDDVVLAEEQCAVARSGQTIRYTPLAAGCMAVTALFEGGGAGVHLAMMPNNANQWLDFLAQIHGKTITEAFVDYDMLGDREGWRVKYNVDELEPDLTVAPRSTAHLVQEGMDIDQINRAGWVIDPSSIYEWFNAALGVAAHFNKNTTPAHVIP